MSNKETTEEILKKINTKTCDLKNISEKLDMLHIKIDESLDNIMKILMANKEETYTDDYNAVNATRAEYRKLMNEFMKKTDELENLYTQYNNIIAKKNSRNAGRKRKLSDQDKGLIKMYRMQRYSIIELAQMFNCSTSLISNVINDK